MSNPVIRACVTSLVHVPDMVRLGSKPRREIAKDPALEPRVAGALRTFEAASAYPPNQVVIGNLSPRELAAIPRPWFDVAPQEAERAASSGPFGDIVPQDLFYAVLEQSNVLEPPLVELADDVAGSLHEGLRDHPVLGALAHRAVHRASREQLHAATEHDEALTLMRGGSPAGVARRDARAEGREDRNLDAPTLLEALTTKASAAIALRSLLVREDLDPAAVDFLISCGEEATGDRYQRGGGGMAKAVGEICGCTGASGMDVRNFCAAPASALVTAGAMVKAGLYERVVVVAGGSLAKLGMKFQALLREGMPLIGDCLGCFAFLVTRDDGESPVLRLERGAVGTAKIGASVSDEAVYRELILGPLEALGLRMEDVDRYAPELHNPELMEHAGSGDVVRKNYRMIAATAVMAGQIERREMNAFIERAGMVGFAPPQGHCPSGVPYLAHAVRAMRQGTMRRVMVLSKASLFLNRLTSLYDGVSFVVETNPAAAG